MELKPWRKFYPSVIKIVFVIYSYPMNRKCLNKFRYICIASRIKHFDRSSLLRATRGVIIYLFALLQLTPSEMFNSRRRK